MDELNFVRSAAGLYYAGAIPTPADGPTAAYLPVAGDPGIASVPLTVTWNDAAIRGPYLLLARAPADEPSFIDAVKSLLSTLDPDTRFLWIDEPDARPLVASSLAVRQAGGSGAGVVVETRSYPSNGFRLDLSAGMGVDVRLPDGFAITAGTAGGATLVDESDGKPFGVCGSTLVLALPAATACSIVVPLDVSAADLGARTGGDIRYFYRDANSALVELRYPLFAALQDTTLAFDARFDLRAAPGVGGLTELRFARGSLQARYPSQLLTTTGLRLALTPDSDAGFVRARVPGPDAPGYLTPHGTFTAMPDVRRNGRTTAAAAPAWLPGLVATECVPFPAGLRFTFTGPGAAYAPAFPPLADRDDAVLLSSEGTTAWLLPSGPAGESLDYYSQPLTSVYYAPGDLQQGFMSAVPVQLSQFAPDAQGVPAAPYGGVNGDSDLLAAFEAAILAPMRAQQMPILPGGPRFDAPATGAALLRPAGDDAAGACLTPQGLIALVNVETDRTWKALQLARSPADPDLIVQFPGDDAGDGTRRIAARLATALMRDPLFLVVTRRERAAVDPTYTIGTFEARLAIDAFKPDLAPAAQDEPLGTILIFKFHPLPLADLVADSGVWSERAAFTNDEDLAAVQTMVADAVGSKDPAFDHFRTIVLDPAWNGILALSCTLGLEGLPLELTGLLGGMDRELRVHHIGIDINRVSSEPVSLTDSSVFGLIRYPAPEAPAPLWTRDPEPVPAYDYVVDEMTVVFRNSSLVNFDARVTVTINELFGRAVQLVGRETNELVIEGSYQKQAGSTAFLFVAKDPAPFSFPVGTDELRLLRNFWGGAAEFTTVSAQDQHVEARFAFAGQLEFRADMLPFDAFGYSDPERALPLTGVGLDVAFDLVDRVPANRTIRFDASRVAVDPSATQPAGNSLPGSFPLTLRRLIAAAGDGALTASELGGQIVQVVDFTRANLATPSPKYALDFLLPLGTLGALSSVHVSFDAHLIVGWGPHPTIAARDAISIAVQLPGVTPGFRGMELQGILKTSFATANMGRFPYAESANRAAGHAYLLSFNDVGLRLFGFKLPPGYVVDALMFAGEGDPSLSNLGWYLGVKPQEDEPLLVGAGTSAQP